MDDRSGDSAEASGRLRARALAHERHAHISRALRAAGTVQVADVAARLGVSDMTIRRDFVEMERDGRLRRVRGGAVATNPALPLDMDGEEPSFEARLNREAAAKAAIAAAAAEMVSGCRSLAMDVGTTTYMMARHLTDLQHAKIFTNSLRIAGLLANAAPEVYVAGGRVRADEMAVIGPAAVRQFEQLWFDVAIVGVSGITAEGLFDYAFDEVDMKRVYLRRSDRKIVLCDASKFRRMSLVQVGQLGEATVLVTNAEPPPDLRNALAAAGVEIRVAAPG